MRIFPWRCAFTSPQYFTFSLLSIQLFTFTLFFFLKLGTLFQPNDNISMLFCCHRTNLPLTLPIFLTPHIFCNSLCTYICIFPAFVFLPPLYFCQDSCPASKAYICVCCGSLAACWHSQFLLTSILNEAFSFSEGNICFRQRTANSMNKKYKSTPIQICTNVLLSK